MRDAGEPERSGPVDDGTTRQGWGVAHDGVEGDREGICEHGRLVGHGVGYRMQHRVVGSQQLGPGAGRVGDDTDVDARSELSLREAPAQAQVAGLARRARRIDATRAAGQPGVEHDALTDLESLCRRPELDHLGDHFVTGHVREGRERRHRVVHVAVAEVTQHELRIGTADSREQRSGQHPVRTDQPRILDVVEAEGETGEHLVHSVSGLRSGLGPFGRPSEHQCLHLFPRLPEPFPVLFGGGSLARSAGVQSRPRPPRPACSSRTVGSAPDQPVSG